MGCLNINTSIKYIYLEYLGPTDYLMTAVKPRQIRRSKWLFVLWSFFCARWSSHLGACCQSAGFRNFLSRHTLFPELNKLPLCLLNSSKSLLNAHMKQHFQIMLNEQQKFDTFNEIWADFIILDCSRLFQKPYRWVFFLSSCLHQWWGICQLGHYGWLRPQNDRFWTFTAPCTRTVYNKIC